MGPNAASPIQSNGGSYTVTVKSGDTLYRIARTSGVPIRAIIDTNGLTPPYTVAVGQKLVIPAGRYYTVRKNDTLYGISRSFGIDMATLASLNDLPAPYTISEGQKLQLPAEASASTATAAALDTEYGAVAPAAPAEGGGQPSGAISSSALPPPGPSPAPSNAPASVQASSGTAPSSSSGMAVSQPAEAPAPASTPAPAASTPTPAPAAAASVIPSAGMMWPVRGRVISAYGSQEGGTRNDGINIAAAAGSQVVAADNGTVAYAGNELKGYGNLLIVKQANGVMTAYAHNQKLLVARGATVRKGQPIALVGQTGSVTSPQLHFEVRKGSKAVDPMSVLPAQG